MAKVIPMKKTRNLVQIAQHIHKLDEDQKTSWYEKGLLLGEARAQIPSDLEFGQWCKAQKFQGSQSQLFRLRACAEFVSTHAQAHGRLEERYKQTVIIEMVDRPKTQQDEILRQDAEGRKWSRDAIRKEFPTKSQQAKQKEKASTESKIQKEVEKRMSKAKKSFDRRVEERAEELIEERLEAELKITRQKQKEANEERRLFEARTQRVDSLMSKDAYKTILSCLHPDRECPPDRKSKAFHLFKRLQPLVF